MMRNYFAWMSALLFVLGMLASCGEKKDPIIEEEPDSEHTLLIYMIGDNNLSTYCKSNTTNCIKGLLDSPKPLNLVIYEDSYVSGEARGGNPVLFRLKRNAVDKHKIDTLDMKQYPQDWNSSDPEVMASVLNDVFKQYDTEVKGLELWSHALGWIPSSSYRLPVETSRPSGNVPTRASQWIGMDDGREMDIWDLRKTLEHCPHLDYIYYDACNMGQAEVAYELRGVADYMLACPTEIMAAGLPYDTMIRSLSTCQNKSSLLPALKMVVEDFATLYDGSSSHEGTFALTDLRQIATVHDAYMALRAAYPDRVELLQEHPYTYDEDITHYGRSIMGSEYYFYDLLDAARFFADADTVGPTFSKLQQALDKAVVKDYHTSSFLEIRNIRSCGLGVGIPELFQASPNTRTLQAAYQELQWSQHIK